MRARRERQDEILRRKRYTEPWRAWKLEVAYYDQPLMGGWQAMLITYGTIEREWIDRDRKYYCEEVMRLFPLTLFGWEDWKPEFARRFKRRKQDHRPVGVATIWKRGHDMRLKNESIGE